MNKEIKIEINKRINNRINNSICKLKRIHLDCNIITQQARELAIQRENINIVNKMINNKKINKIIFIQQVKNNKKIKNRIKIKIKNRNRVNKKVKIRNKIKKRINNNIILQ